MARRGSTVIATKSGRIEDALLSYAVGNLPVAPFWYLFFGRNNMGFDTLFVRHFYELPQEFSGVDALAAAVLGLLLSITIYLVLRLLRRLSQRLSRAAEALLSVPTVALIMALIAYVLLRTTIGRSGAFAMVAVDELGRAGQAGFAVLTAIAAMGAIALLLRRRALVVFRAIVLCAAPAGAVMAANGAAAYLKTVPAGSGFLAVDYALAPPQPLPSDRHPILMVIFDEWDYRLTFEARRPGVRLPELDRLAATSFMATNLERAGASTFYSMPGLISGRKLADAERIAGDDLRMTWAEDGSTVRWRATPGLFDDARASGYSTAIVSTSIHPYCRIFHKAISDCWVDAVPFDYSRHTILNRLDDVVLGVPRHIPYARSFLGEVPVPLHEHPWIDLTFRFREVTKQKVLDPRFSFVFLHIRLPHEPYIYALESERYEIVGEDDPLAYWGNLVAVDHFLGDLRRSFESAGIWDDLVVVLTADTGHKGDETHVRRDPLHRVPLLIKLPDATTEYSFDERVSATRLRGLLREIFAGRATAPADLAAALRRLAPAD